MAHGGLSLPICSVHLVIAIQANGENDDESRLTVLNTVAPNSLIQIATNLSDGSRKLGIIAVSYTHLTLPTIYSV